MQPLSRNPVAPSSLSVRRLEKGFCVRPSLLINLSQIFTAYSGYRMCFREVPAAYSEVFVYADEETLKEIKRRFPEKKGPPNLFVLKADRRLKGIAKGDVAPPVQLFADLWNLREWYAKEFVNALLKRIGD